MIPKRSDCRALLLGILLACQHLHAAITSYELIGRGVQKRFHPQQAQTAASVQKMITMYLAWNILGPSFRFHTELRQIDARSYQMIFSFDPSLKTEDIDRMLRYLPKNQPLKIELVSNGLLQPQHPDWKAGDLNRCYGAPIGPAIIDRNCHHVKEVIFTGKKKTPSNKKHRPQSQIRKKQVMSYQRVFHPYRETPAWIKARAARQGIHIQSVRWTLQKKTGRTLSEKISDPLSSMMHQAIKQSHNLTMDAIWLACAQKIGTHKLRWHEASHMLSQYLHRKVPNAQGLKMSDGSGLSPRNKVTVAALDQVMVRIEQQETLFRWALSAFPLAGKDGTLRSRFMHHRPFLSRMRIIAKTGTFKSVRNLCGWVFLNRGKVLRLIWLEEKSPKSAMRPSSATDHDVMQLIQSTQGSHR